MKEMRRAMLPHSMLRVEFAPDLVEHYELVPIGYDGGQKGDKHFDESEIRRYWFDVKPANRAVNPRFSRVFIDPLDDGSFQWSVSNNVWELSPKLFTKTDWYCKPGLVAQSYLVSSLTCSKCRIPDYALDKVHRRVVTDKDRRDWSARLECNLGQALDAWVYACVIEIILSYLTFVADSCWVDIFTGGLCAAACIVLERVATTRTLLLNVSFDCLCTRILQSVFRDTIVK